MVASRAMSGSAEVQCARLRRLHKRGMNAPGVRGILNAVGLGVIPQAYPDHLFPMGPVLTLSPSLAPLRAGQGRTAQSRSCLTRLV